MLIKIYKKTYKTHVFETLNNLPQRFISLILIFYDTRAHAA